MNQLALFASNSCCCPNPTRYGRARTHALLAFGMAEGMAPDQKGQGQPQAPLHGLQE